MKKVLFWAMGMASMISIVGCEAEINEVLDNDKTVIKIVNSAQSTWRIVKAKYTISTTDTLGKSIDVGDGIHIGKSILYETKTSRGGTCDIEWAIQVTYNDSYGSSCIDTKTVKCKTTTTFTFDNNTCGQ